MAESLRGCFCLQEVRAAIRSQPLVKSRPNPSARQTKQQPWGPHVPTVPIYRIQTGILHARSPKFKFDSSESNFACLSAEHISDPGSKQDHR